MPIFEYQCDRCQEIFDLLVRSAEYSISCPECNSKEVSKLFSTFAVAGVERGSSGSSCSTCSSGNCSQCH